MKQIYTLTTVLLFILVSNKLLAQCAITTGPTNDCSYGDAIDNFTLNGSTVSNTGCSGASTGYTFFSTPVWTLKGNSTNSFSVTVGGATYNQGFAIWIDLNNDSIFDASEMLYASGSAALSHSGTITIPCGVTYNQNLRMRLMCAYNVNITSGQACTSNLGNYGETEDYMVNIQLPDLAMAASGNSSSIAGSDTSTSGVSLPGSQTAFLSNANCGLIAGLANAASLGATTAIVNVESSVQTHNSQPYVSRWYQITPTTNNIATDITLYFTQDDFNQYNTYASANSWPLLPANPTDVAGINNLVITKNDDAGLGANPLVLIPSGVTWNTTANRWEVMANTPSFSQFRVHAANSPNTIPLPVNIQFTAHKEMNANKLEWTTTYEKNNKQFNVQKSTDGIAFETIGTLASKAISGNSSAELRYSFEDTKPLLGHNYYRLEQVDMDGKRSFTNIVDLIWIDNGDAITVYPNPVQDELNIDLNITKKSLVEIRLMDMSGKLISQKESSVETGLNNIHLNTSQLGQGFYNLQVYINGTLSSVTKLSKNK